MGYIFLKKIIRLSYNLICLAAFILLPAQAHAQSYVAISAGENHSLGLKADGTLWAWGACSHGIPWVWEAATPIQVDEGFTTIAAGGSHSLGVKTDGSLWAWGDNTYGQLGDGTTSSHNIPPIQVGEGFATIAAGGSHSLGLKTDGSLWAWGDNTYGQLGDSTTEDRYLPVRVGEGFTIIAAGYNYSLGLKPDGSLWAWGDNAYGQLGDGATTGHTIPVHEGEGFTALAAGYRHSLGLKSDGSLWAWGDNTFGQLGDGTPTDQYNPVQVGEGFVDIAIGKWHSLGLKSDGSIWAWGRNRAGQLGDGTTTDRYDPMQMGEGFTALAGGGEHSLGLKGDGTLCAWGNNEYGQLGNGNTDESPIPVLAGGSYHYIPYAPGMEDFALGFGLSNMDTETTACVYVDYFNSDGEKVGQDLATVPANGQASFMSGVNLAQSGWARVSSSNPIKGMALVFGHGEDPLFDMDFKVKESTYLAAAHVDTEDGWVTSAMLANPNGKPAQVAITFYPSDGGDSQTADLTIPAMGAVQYDLDVFGMGTGSIRIYSDQNIVGFLLYDGRGKGSHWAGGLSLVPANMSFAGMSAGGDHSLGLDSDGVLWSWGQGHYGQLGDGTEPVHLEDWITCALPTPRRVGDGFTALAAGSHHSLGIKNDSSLWAWGLNHHGQLGDGSETIKYTPVQVGEGFVTVAAGSYYSLGVKVDGSLWAWGYNQCGKLGDGTTTDRSTPVQVGEGFTSIAAGSEHSLGLKTDGSLWAWGWNEYGQLGDGTQTDKHTPVQTGEGFLSIAAGANHSLGLKTDGALWAWGKNEYGQLGDGTTTDRYDPILVGEGFTTIAAGDNHSLGLKTDGSLWTWGRNHSGQLGDGTSTDSYEPILVGEDYTAIAAGDSFSLGLKSDGTLWGWGLNESGQLGEGTTTTRLTPVRVGKGFGGDPNEQGEYIYYVPYAPDNEDFDLGFGIANAHNVLPAAVTVEYYSNAGAFLGQETATIQPYGQTSFMCGVTLEESGWARVVSDQPLYGLALGVGYGDDPLFDMDFKPATAATLTAAHVDTGGGWISKAMLANPNAVQADVTIAFTPADGVIIQTVAELNIPAMGAVQYDLAAAFPNASGAIKVASDQGLVGFLLYDGRGVSGDFSGFNYVGGLSMVAAD